MCPAAGGKPLASLKKCLSQIPKSVKDTEVVSPLKMKKRDILALKSRIDKAEKCIREIQDRTNMDKEELEEYPATWWRSGSTSPKMPRAS